MIIDCHGHYTTAPKALEMFRNAQIAALADPKGAPARSLQISDDQVRETLVPAQLKLQQERGTDIAIFPPGGRQDGPPHRHLRDQQRMVAEKPVGLSTSAEA
jgi:hypothetical protein